MSADASSIAAQFRDTLVACKRLYIHAARDVLDQRGDTDQTVRHDFIRRMVNLHKGLVLKIYVTIARADRQWTRAERQLARDLIDHLWQQQLQGAKLREAAKRMFRDAESLRWYSLLRPFDQIPVLRGRISELETVIVRLANLVAKADGKMKRDEADALRGIQREVETLLRRLPLDEPGQHEQGARQTAQAVEIVHQERVLPREGKSGKLPRGKSSAAATSGHQAPAGRPRPAGPDEHSLAAAMAELDQLVGLDQVKREIRTLTNFLQLQQRRQQAGLPQHELSLHMVFMGNPGTGKTTVARIVGKILRALGMLSKGHLVETDRSGLVAEYAGQTGPKTNRKIDEALDGILFIDEAYSLISQAREDAYGTEAVQALVKRMEDDRGRLVLILAGYPDPMRQLLRSNPGLSSRFNTQIQFDDYRPVDLGRIFDRMSRANHYQLPAESRARLLLGFRWLYEHRDEHFGNGRLVRNVFEDSVRRLANRIVDVAPITRDVLTTLTPPDIRMDGVPDNCWQCLETGTVRFAVICQKCRRSATVKVSQLGAVLTCKHCTARLTADWGEPDIN